MLKHLFFLLCLTSYSVMSAPEVVFETTQGNFTLELDAEKAPVTVENFLRYVEDGSYVGSIFHRVIPGFMVQGGGFNSQMNRLKSYAPIKNEASNGLKNLTATIAMARTQNPDSATRQFYINLVDNPFLDYGERPPGYAVFGRVTSGFSAIQAIGKQKTKTTGHMQNVPVKPIVITKVTLLKEKSTPEPQKVAN
ncbi:Peptidyl-prolyl cis-trans isomerase A precursor [Vibrio aerogenes CECT 7868]|uniref:Peptidyl-prolyl cis-trans isomerase n=1 Tax=Vibrio aerogenes CECT 7868 TaxID=1216006 RepID=A0A1M5WLG7_9VIBR|nr:peptidylprolyl isomerase [Vibrio aerogenes]SHH88004.1 Peptidyl-prolyl cis-trans isomerase A precursor [Vibrio aerogenes CECT 7868]